MKRFLLSLIGLLLISCWQKEPDNLYQLAAINSNGHIVAVIEIPAGTNKKIEIEPKSGQFVIDQRDGKDRVIDYLPYPANYGFIPGTLVNEVSGGDGDALDVFVLAESLPTAQVIEIIPICMVQMLDDGEQDDKILAVPKEESLRIIQATSLTELQLKYPTLLQGLENWLLAYDPVDPKEIQGWVNEQTVRTTIEASIKK